MRECAVTLESELSGKELELLTSLLKENALTGRHLEIGTAAGGTLWQMMQCYPSESRPPFVVVDPMGYFPNQLELVQKNLRDHDVDPGGVEFRQMKGYDAFKAALANDETYDFILVDGSHKFRYVVQDLCWTRLLRPGGILCMHDYEPKFPGVTMAADHFLRRNGNYEKISVVERLLAVRKKSESSKVEVSGLYMLYAQLRTPFMQLRKSLEKRFGAG